MVQAGSKKTIRPPSNIGKINISRHWKRVDTGIGFEVFGKMEA